jgi:hypothetical protein
MIPWAENQSAASAHKGAAMNPAKEAAPTAEAWGLIVAFIEISLPNNRHVLWRITIQANMKIRIYIGILFAVQVASYITPGGLGQCKAIRVNLRTEPT